MCAPYFALGFAAHAARQAAASSSIVPSFIMGLAISDPPE
jgi:hypothetical protein